MEFANVHHSPLTKQVRVVFTEHAEHFVAPEGDVVFRDADEWTAWHGRGRSCPYEKPPNLQYTLPLESGLTLDLLHPWMLIPWQNFDTGLLTTFW
jgi:hypothetical protein